MQDFNNTEGGFNFDVSDVNPDGQFEPIPKGTYLVQYDSFEDKQNSKGTGRMVKVELTVIGGPFDGRKLFDNFNYSNPNPDAVRIAMQQMKQFVLAASGGERGQKNLNLDDFAALVGAEVSVNVDVDGEYNRVKKYAAAGNAPAPAATKPAAAEQPKQASGSGQSAMPWAS